MSIAIESRFRDVEKLVLIAEAKGLDPEVAAYYCKLGCVMICGTVERSVEILITERLRSRSTPQVICFLKAFFKRGKNYDCEEILSLLHKFDNGWGHKFNQYMTDNDQIKSSVTSCYAIRNSIAHGGTQSLGPTTLRQYYNHAFTLIVELESLLRS